MFFMVREESPSFFSFSENLYIESDEIYFTGMSPNSGMICMLIKVS